MSNLSRFGLLGTGWLLLMGVLALLYMTVPPSPDQSQFDWMAFIATQGGPYYTSSFDMNWPGAMWLHETGLRLFGVHAWTWRLTDFLLLTGFTAAGAVFLARAKWQLAAVLFLFLYPMLYVTAGSWMAGQRDIIATGFLITSCAMAMPGGRREGISIFFAGVCIAIAVLIRPTYLSFLAGLMFLELLPLKVQQVRTCRPLGRVLRVALGFSVVIGAAVLTGLIQGNLDDWYQQSIQFSTSIYISEPPQDWRRTLSTLFLVSWNWISILALFGLLGWVWRDRFGYALVLVLGVAATCTVSFIIQNKGFGYHLGGILIVLVLWMSIAIDWLNQWRRVAGVGLPRIGVLMLVCGLVLAGTAKKLVNLSQGAERILAGQIGPTDAYGLTEEERRRIVAMIQEGSSPGQTIAVYGTNYDLAYRAKRLPTYRYFTPAADQTNADFVHHEAWLVEVDTALVQHAPAFVIIDRDMISGPPETPRSAHPERSILSRLIAVLDGYEIVFINDDVVVYRSGAL